jgi:peroxiredoxin
MRCWVNVRRFRPLTIALIIVLAAAMAFATGCKKSTPRASNGRGTGFTLKDLSGKDVSLKDFRGKVVLLEFWATWCPPCRASVPELIKLDERFKGRDFALIAVSLDDNTEAVKEFVKEKGIPYTVLMDDRKASEEYGVFSIPTSFIIDRNGVVLSKHAGYAEGMIGDISNNIENLLSGKSQPPASVPVPEGQSSAKQEPAKS